MEPRIYLYPEDPRDRFRACVLGGAIGDAFGAPLEGYSQKTIRTRTGSPQGLLEMPAIDDIRLNKNRPAGQITDDTNMLAMTLIAAGLVSPEADREDFLHHTWQAYLRWGDLQEESDGEGLSAFFDPHIDWPEIMEPFLREGGAGRGTIAALATGQMGTTQHPLQLNRQIRGRKVEGLNKGCGGMMRIAPIGFAVPFKDVFATATATAAITHGDADAYNAAGEIALWVARGMKRGLYDIVDDAPASESLRKIFITAAEHTRDTRFDPAVMDNLPAEIGENNHFTARSVFAQVTYVLTSAFGMRETPENFKAAIRCAANITGDSDSVAAIVGNVLGASWGMRAIPKDWLERVAQKDNLERLIDWSIPRLHATATLPPFYAINP